MVFRHQQRPLTTGWAAVMLASDRIMFCDDFLLILNSRTHIRTDRRIEPLLPLLLLCFFDHFRNQTVSIHIIIIVAIIRSSSYEAELRRVWGSWFWWCHDPETIKQIGLGHFIDGYVIIWSWKLVFLCDYKYDYSLSLSDDWKMIRLNRSGRDLFKYSSDRKYVTRFIILYYK